MSYLPYRSTESADDLFKYKETLALMKRSLTCLSPMRREVVRLRLLEGLEPNEIMEQSGLTRNQVDNAYPVGMDKLRELIKGHDQEGTAEY